MRELKFRAWDTHSKGMHPGFTLQEIVQIMRNPEPPGIEAVAYQFAFNELIFMQYTGLKDKNGKEIYEGDIVNAGGDIMQIVYGIPPEEKHDGSKFIIPMFYGKFKDESDWVFIERDDSIDVIGNIYENPELIKP